jgi:hypothetical protein
MMFLNRLWFRLLLLGLSLLVAGAGFQNSARAEQAQPQSAPRASLSSSTASKTANEKAPPTLATAETKSGPGSPSPRGSDAKTALAISPPSEMKAAPALSQPSPSKPSVPAATATNPNQLSAALLQGPSLYETGRVGKMGLSEAGVQIRQTRNRISPQELRVQPKTELALHAQPGIRPGAIDTEILRREIKSRFVLLRDCRVEVARHKRIAPGTVTASRLTLRWTILPDGRVTETQVVATSRVDGEVMNCVKRQMSRWSFSPPIGGPVRVERPFAFHSR